MRRPAIRARIAEIRRVLARAYCLDAQVLLGKLEAVYQRANERHYFHAAARCVELQARIAGHLATTKETRGADGRSPDRDKQESGADGRSPDRENQYDDIGTTGGRLQDDSRMREKFRIFL